MHQDKLSCGRSFQNMIDFFLKKATSKNIENLQEVVIIQTHCLYPHPQLDVVQINALEYDSDIDGPTEQLPDKQPSVVASHTACTEEVSSHSENIEEDKPQSLPIPKNTPPFHRILIDLNLSPNQFWIGQNI